VTSSMMAKLVSITWLAVRWSVRGNLGDSRSHENGALVTARGQVRAEVRAPRRDMSPGDPLVFCKPGVYRALAPPSSINPDQSTAPGDTVESWTPLYTAGGPVNKRRGRTRPAAGEPVSIFDEAIPRYGNSSRRADSPLQLRGVRSIRRADGLVTALVRSTANSSTKKRSRCIGMAYDYTVFADPSYFSHKKMIACSTGDRCDFRVSMPKRRGRPTNDVPRVSGLR